MKKEEHKALLDKLKNCTSDADRVTLLVELEKDYTTILSENETALQQAKDAKEESTKYAKLNNELWLANSVQEKAGQVTATKDDPIEEPPAKRTYEDLESKF